MYTLKQATAFPLQKSYDSLRILQAPIKVQWKKLAVPLGDEVRFIPFEEIVYCKSVNNYTTIFTQDDRSFLCCRTLKDIESKLPADVFIRIHHSYLVNLHFITSLKKQNCEMEINNKLLLPVSRGKKTEIYKLFNV